MTNGKKRRLRKIEVPKGSGSRERMLEASAAEDFKEAANRISMVKQSRVRVPMVNHRELVIFGEGRSQPGALQHREVWDFLSSPCVCDGKEMGQKLTGLRETLAFFKIESERDFRGGQSSG